MTELVVGDHWTSGAELQNKFLPRKIDDKIVRWEFDFKVLSEGTTSNWFNIAWAWDVYNANEFTTPGNLTNGLYFQLNQLATSPETLYLQRGRPAGMLSRPAVGGYGD